MITRRQFLGLAAATAYSSVLSACGRNTAESAQKQLNIYSWPDYIHEGAIPEFESRYGIKVVYDTVSSNEGLIAKLQAGASNYDIVVPSNYAVTKLRKMKLLQNIQHDRLKNFKNLMARFRNLESSADSNRNFAVPYTFGTTGIAFNSSVIVSPAAYPDSWEAFWDKRFAGRMTLLEDARESLGMALKHRGHSVNCVDANLIHEACNDLKAQKRMVMCYTSDQVITSLSTGDSHLSLAFSGDAQQAARANKSVKYVIPTSGCSMWTDNMCIPAGAPHVEYAHLWIDYILEAKVSAALSNFTLYATPNQAAMEFVDDELKHNPELYPSDGVLAKCEEINDIGSAIFIYDRLWSELKCS
ncbi:MAG: spermidine/putrescine ABC transporter substrate-binding protein [Candidatus Obscuribacterales bacterium]|nr:spermidine/putrescine ABC transporter substrate-binding protein [Candidatus Obscuribacterales bacterium]